MDERANECMHVGGVIRYDLNGLVGIPVEGLQVLRDIDPGYKRVLQIDDEFTVICTEEQAEVLSKSEVLIGGVYMASDLSTRIDVIGEDVVYMESDEEFNWYYGGRYVISLATDEYIKAEF